MKRAFLLSLTILAIARVGFAQVSGNIGYSQAGGKARAEQNERAKRTLAQGEMPPSGTSMFVEANVLMNVKADEYVAVFGVSREGNTVAECNRTMDGVLHGFSDELKPLGIASAAVSVDFVAQNRIYGYDLEGNVAKEKVAGFEVKKTISIRYQDKAVLDKLLLAAARSDIFDLIKVDYIVEDTHKVQERLVEEAAKVIKQKVARYETLLGIELQPAAQVYAERPSIYYPTQMYDSYTAYEAEEIGRENFRQRYTVQSARKSRTFFFNALDADGFDLAIGPVALEPVVQFTLYLKVKYEIEHKKSK